MNFNKKATVITITISVIGILLSSCGAQKTDNKQTNNNDTNIKIIKVGTMGTYNPFSYQDENGQLTGYDIEVLREIDERIDDIELEFVPTPWDSMFLGLESDKYQIVANQISKNPEREEKYSFSSNSYFASTSTIIVKKGRKGITSLDDLKGLKVGTAVGDSFTKILEDYNLENDNALELKYYDGNVTTVLQDLEAGRIDAYLNDPIMVNQNVKKLGLDVEPTGDPVQVSPAYFVFRKDAQGEELKEKIDDALSNMKEDGTLSDISVQWFEDDYTKIVE